MKKQFLRMVAFVLLMTMTLLLVSCGKEETSAVPEEDGSDQNTTVVDAPKTMESTEITAFDCTFSTLDMDEGDLSGHVYTLQASLQAGTVNGGITIRDHSGNSENNVFTADAVFMQQLQSIVKDHALASHNGLRHQVSGLPDTYGAELCVTYASGEEISAGDNQDNFLSPAAMRALVELFSGAVTPEQVPETVPAEKPEEYPLVFGMYRGLEPDSDGMEVWMELIEFPEFLLLEFHHTIDGSVVVFRAEEFWPDEPCEGIWTAAQLTGKSQEFSMIQQEVGYYGMPRDCDLEPTENGLIVKYEDGEELTFELDNSFCGHTTQEEQLQIMWENYEMTYIEMELVGPWMNWDDGRAIRISLDGDGAFRMLYKEPGYPVRALRGVWGVGLDSGDLLAMAELVGGGAMPHPISWQWSLDENELLNIYGESPFAPGAEAEELQLWPQGLEEGLYCAQDQALGYLYSHYDMNGEYTDQYGTDYYYWYQVPRFLGETGDLAEINKEILDIFGPIIEQEVAAMEAQEFLTADTVMWDSYITEGILAIHVYSYSWEWEEHRVWYYDLENEIRTDSRELLKRLGIDEKEFLEAVRRAAEDCYVKTFADVPEEYRDQYGYDDLLAWTVSEEAVNLDLPIFVNELGDLCVYGRIGSMAGAGVFWQPLFPFTQFG